MLTRVLAGLKHITGVILAEIVCPKTTGSIIGKRERNLGYKHLVLQYATKETTTQGSSQLGSHTKFGV